MRITKIIKPTRFISNATLNLGVFATICASSGVNAAPVGCLIESSQVSDVAAATAGVIAQINADRGTFVKRGQVIASLVADVERANLDVAKSRAASEAEIDANGATRDLAKLKVKRLHDLLALGHGTQMELDQARGEFEVSDHKWQHAKDMHVIQRKDVGVAQSYLEQRLIRSPIDGVVAERLLNVGERTDGKPLFKIIALQKLKAELVLPAAQFGTVREGMSATVLPDVINGKNALAQVSQVDRFVDAASGTFRARLQINNFDKQVPAGVKCKVEFSNSAAAATPKLPAQPVATIPAGSKPNAQKVSVKRPKAVLAPKAQARA